MNVLAIGAHPDDETFAAGTLAKYAAEGNDVYILITTRGEGGAMGDPPLTDRAGLGAVREQEARAAARALGAKDIFFLPYRDPVIGEGHVLYTIDATLEDFSAAIAEVIASLKPDIVITHGSGGEYGHPQHKFTHAAVFAALDRLKPWRPQEVLTWCAAIPGAEEDRFTNKDDPADIVVDVSPWFDRKVAAMDAHRTQHVVFFRNNPDKTLADITRRIESFHRWA
jgi:LmbE family N-acetylglucosaminyl deacetylase